MQFNVKVKLMTGLMVVASYATNNISAESYVVEEASVKVFNVASNETIIFTGGFRNVSSVETTQYGIRDLFAGQNFDAFTIEHPFIITGPALLTFFPGIYNTRHLTNSQFKTEWIVPFITTNIINVTSNQSIKFFNRMTTPGFCQQVTVTSGTNSVSISEIQIDKDFEFDGPITFTFHTPCTNWQEFACSDTNNPACQYEGFLAAMPYTFLTYTIFDRDCDSQTNGLASLHIEKSSNLVDWSDKGRFIVQANEPYEFYRLRLDKLNACNNSQYLFGGGGQSFSQQGEWQNTPNLPPLPWSP